jgi:pantothenate kinase
MTQHAHSLHATTITTPGILPPGAVGVDAGMTMTKIARATSDGIEVSAKETDLAPNGEGWAALRSLSGRVGVTGARLGSLAACEGAVVVQEIDAAARGCVALLEAEDRLGDGAFLMALLGTGTAFAAVRDGKATHLGGTALGGGAFAAIARRVAPHVSYDEMIAAAERGDRRNVDQMISDVYPDGIGRIGPDLTAAHLSKRGSESLDDFLAGLLNLHGESIGQIAAGRARMASMNRIVLCGGFIHHNEKLAQSIAHMAGLFGHQVEAVAHPGYAGAIGAALVAAAVES